MTVDLDTMRARVAHLRREHADALPMWEREFYARDLPRLIAEVDRLHAEDERLSADYHRVLAERDEERAKVEVLLLADKALQSRIWLNEECARLRVDLYAAKAALADVTGLLDEARTERDAARAEVAEEIAAHFEAISRDTTAWVYLDQAADIAREHAVTLTEVPS